MAAQLACLPDEVERSEGYRARRSGHTAEGAPLLKDPRSAEQERAAVEAWEGEGGSVLREKSTPSPKDAHNGPGILNPVPQPERPLGGGTMARFYVAALLHYTVERPDAWTADKEMEYVRSNTTIGQYPLDEVEITYFEPAESEGGEG